METVFYVREYLCWPILSSKDFEEKKKISLHECNIGNLSSTAKYMKRSETTIKPYLANLKEEYGLKMPLKSYS